jgi:hypothetical protein
MRRLIALALVAGCASAAAPPGGAERHTPPEIVSISPDSGDINVKIKSVEFKFDEVVSDRPGGSGATLLDQLFLISPMDGGPDVSWHRSRITVRPRKGFRANTAYRITMLPGVVDLRGNARKEPRTIVFSTGPTFPPFSIHGRVFDWSAQRPAIGAYIEAKSRADTTLVYVSATDSLGQFEAGPLSAGTYSVRALIDANANRTLDRNEKWDSLAVVVQNVSPTIELDAIERDTTPAFFESVTALDSVTLRLTFDKAIDPALPLQPALFKVQRPDSSELQIVKVQWQSAYDQSRQAADSARRADSTRARPPTAPPVAAPTTPGARPAPPPPKPQSPPPERGVILTLAPTTPVLPTLSYRVTALSMRNLLGKSRVITRPITIPKPAPRDTTRKPAVDTTRRIPPPPRR